MTGNSAPPELPPELAQEYLQGARAQLGLLSELADRLVAASNDAEALDLFRREVHKVHGAAGSFGFRDASRLAAGMEATVNDWIAGPEDKEVARGSMARWFVVRLAKMLKLEVPSATRPNRPADVPFEIPSIRGQERPTQAPGQAPAPTSAGGMPRKIPAEAPAGRPTEPHPKVPATARPGHPADTPGRGQAPAPTPARPSQPPPAEVPRKAPAAMPEARPATAPPERPSTAPVGEGLSIVPEVIVVEDDPALLELLQYGLQSRGYRFVSYRDGREALDALLRLDPGESQPLLLLDVDLPALDGYSIFEALQRERPGAYRVVFTTVHGTEDEQLRGLEAGALDYLVKPISLRVVLEKIRRWVGR